MKVKVTRYGLVWLIICLAAIQLHAQTIQLHIKPVDKDSTFIASLLLKKTFTNLQQGVQYVNQLPTALQLKGFVSASVDSIETTTTAISIYLFTGNQYQWKELLINPQDKPLLNQLGFKSNNYIKQTFNPQQIFGLQEKLLNYFEKNGYPFATLQLDSVQIANQQVTAKLLINRGIEYRMDSIRLYGNAKINKSFLYHHLDMPVKSLYSLVQLEKINQRLLELPYLQQAQPWDITMLGSSYLLNLYLQPRRSNQIDAIVGFLPANQQLGGKLLFTVDAKVNLQNTFAAGESIALNWQQIQPKSPRIEVSFQRPYLFNSGFGFNFNFNLYKRDSAFLNINAAIGVDYKLSAKQKFKILLQSFSTSLLDVDTATIKFTKKLPDIIDASNTSLGLEYEFNNTDYRFNPRRGSDIKLQLSAGSKKVKRNNSITNIKDAVYNYNKLYDSLELNTYQVKLKLTAAHYFSITKFSSLKTVVNAAILQSPNYFRNEMFQIGGYKLLRGFDEESIFSSRFVVATVEYRYFFGLNNFFAAFTDVGNSYSNITNISNTYIGAGFGLGFQTKQGIFNISYAAGKRNDLPLNMRESKIHIGFVSLF